MSRVISGPNDCVLLLLPSSLVCSTGKVDTNNTDQPGFRQKQAENKREHSNQDEEKQQLQSDEDNDDM